MKFIIFEGRDRPTWVFRGVFWEGCNASDEEGLLPPKFGGWGLGFTLS